VVLRDGRPDFSDEAHSTWQHRSQSSTQNRWRLQIAAVILAHGGLLPRGGSRDQITRTPLPSTAVARPLPYGLLVTSGAGRVEDFPSRGLLLPYATAWENVGRLKITMTSSWNLFDFFNEDAHDCARSFDDEFVMHHLVPS